MTNIADTYHPLAAALCTLFPDELEVVLHDLASGTIAHIENAFSARRAGDASLIEVESLEDEINERGFIGPYAKIDADGTRIKTVTFPIRNAQNTITSLVCINLRVEKFEQAEKLLQSILSLTPQTPPQSLLKDDWRELAHVLLREALAERHIALAAAKKPDKLAILAKFDKANLFERRGAPDYLAKLLSMSRASLYSLLREARTNSLANKDTNNA